MSLSKNKKTSARVPAAFEYSHQDVMACDECGQLQSIPNNTGGQSQSKTVFSKAKNTLNCNAEQQLVTCLRCSQPLILGEKAWREKAAALVLAGLILFVVANSFVFLGLDVGAFHHEANLLSGVWALAKNDQIVLSILVFVTIFLFPLVELIILCYLVLPCYLNKRLPFQVTLFRWLTKAAPWSMLEIFLLAVLVTSVKLGDMATIVLGASIMAFFGLVAALGAAYWCINKRELWAWLQPSNCFVGQNAKGDKLPEKLYDCDVCNALVGESVITCHGFCPRCHNQLYTRKPNSLQKTLAYTVAAAILYLPANLLPVMTMTTVIDERADTIFSGVVALVAHDLWGIAAVVFVASLVVPVAKLIILVYLVWSVSQKQTTGMQQRLWLFKVTEWVGRWSMVDVFVVTLLTGLVQFGFLGSITPGSALLPFAAVVVLTMLAAHAFDPRLIWDAAREQELVFADAQLLDHNHRAKQ